MRTKFKIKIIVDIFMMILLILLMLFQITGFKAHEWIGAGMLVLFLAHNFLNVKWYKNIFKGSYSSVRIIQTTVNIAVLAAMMCTMISGIIMVTLCFYSNPIKKTPLLTREI